MNTPLLRPVALPPVLTGALWLCAMPGRAGPLAHSLVAMQRAGITQLICLCGADEVAEKSPDYARILAQGLGPVRVQVCPIADYSVPADRLMFDALVTEGASALEQGASILVHCNAGIGRTGLLAICLLVRAGLTLDDARRRVLAAGSGPETPHQQAFVTGFAAHPA